MYDRNMESFSLRFLFLFPVPPSILAHLFHSSWLALEASQSSQSLNSKEGFLASTFSLRFSKILAVWKKAKRLWATRASMRAVIAPVCVASKAPLWIRECTHLLLVIAAFSGQAE